MCKLGLCQRNARVAQELRPTNLNWSFLKYDQAERFDLTNTATYKINSKKGIKSFDDTVFPDLVIHDMRCSQSERYQK
jgi:hypothetical protein